MGAIAIGISIKEFHTLQYSIILIHFFIAFAIRALIIIIQDRSRKVRMMQLKGKINSINRESRNFD